MVLALAHPFHEIALLVLVAAGVGLVGRLLRQPLIVAYIAVGILAGSGALGIDRSTDTIAIMSEMSIAVLLFLVGLKLDLKLVRTLGPVALATGLGQVAFTVVFGFLLCLAMGIDGVTSLYVAVALTFSSTIIIVKLLSDKREIDSLHGRIALGFLIVQDIVVVLAMVVLSGFGVGAASDAEARSLGTVLGGGAAVLVALGLFMRFAAEPVLRRVARSTELLVIFAVGWAASWATLGDRLGFGMEIGGLLAGVSLASTQYRDAVAARLSSVRDFLLLFFFVALGAGLDMTQVGEQSGRALVLSAFVLVGNPLIVLAIMGWMGYRKRTGFLAGLTVAQISEFSLIFMAMGVSLGHVTASALALVTVVGLVTIAISTYMITYSHHLYAAVERWLTPFERRTPHRQLDTEDPAANQGYDVLLFGLGRYGRAVGRGLLERGYRVLGVDFDPEALARWRAEDHEALYGDSTDPEFLTHLPLARCRAVVSTVPGDPGGLSDADSRAALLSGLREHGFRGKIAVAVRTDHDLELLRRQGADLVLSPFTDGAAYAVETLIATLDPKGALGSDPVTRHPGPEDRGV